MFVEDFVFQAPPAAVPLFIATYEQICAEVGVELVRRSCKAYVPAYAPAVCPQTVDAGRTMAMHQPLLAQIARSVSVTVDHLTVLDNAVGGDYATDLSLSSKGAARINPSPDSPLATRARKASRQAEGLAAMAESQLRSGGKQPAWMVVRDCLANAPT